MFIMFLILCVRGAGGVQTPLSTRSMITPCKPEETARQNVSFLLIFIHFKSSPNADARIHFYR